MLSILQNEFEFWKYLLHLSYSTQGKFDTGKTIPLLHAPRQKVFKLPTLECCVFVRRAFHQRLFKKHFSTKIYCRTRVVHVRAYLLNSTVVC